VGLQDREDEMQREEFGSHRMRSEVSFAAEG
jgi:hypothetical protein